MHQIIAPKDPSTDLLIRFIVWLLSGRKKKEDSNDRPKDKE